MILVILNFLQISPLNRNTMSQQVWYGKKFIIEVPSKDLCLQHFTCIRNDSTWLQYGWKGIWQQKTNTPIAILYRTFWLNLTKPDTKYTWAILSRKFDYDVIVSLVILVLYFIVMFWFGSVIRSDNVTLR